MVLLFELSNHAQINLFEIVYQLRSWRHLQFLAIFRLRHHNRYTFYLLSRPLLVQNQIEVFFLWIIIIFLKMQFLKLVGNFLNQSKLFRIFTFAFFNNSTVEVFQTIPSVLKLIHFVQSADKTMFWRRLRQWIPCSSRPLGYLSINFKNADFLFFGIGARSSSWAHSHHVVVILSVKFGDTTLSCDIMTLKLLLNDVHILTIAYVFAFVIFNIILL